MNSEQTFVLCYNSISERAVPSESLRRDWRDPMRAFTQLLLALAIVMALAIAWIVLLFF